MGFFEVGLGSHLTKMLGMDVGGILMRRFRDSEDGR